MERTPSGPYNLRPRENLESRSASLQQNGGQSFSLASVIDPATETQGRNVPFDNVQSVSNLLNRSNNLESLTSANNAQGTNIAASQGASGRTRRSMQFNKEQPSLNQNDISMGVQLQT